MVVDCGAQVHRFVELCILLKEVFAARGLVPYLVGSRIPGEYANKVVADLKASFSGEASIVKDFMPPAELGLVFQESVLLVLPSLYDSWGMVVTEAAAFGVPSVLHTRGIGAADLLVPPEMSISVDFDAGGCLEAASRVKDALDDATGLAEMGDRARLASLEWDETAYAKKLADVVSQGCSCENASRQMRLALVCTSLDRLCFTCLS